MPRFLTAVFALALPVVLTGTATPSQTQMQTPLQVRPFGGTRGPQAPVKIPPELAQFVPPGAEARFLAPAHLTSAGETLLAYEDNIQENDPFLDSHLLILRNGKLLRKFDHSKSNAGIAGIVVFKLDTKRDAIGVSFFEGADGSGHTFQIIAAKGDSFVPIFERLTSQGRMEITLGVPTRVSLWEADPLRDPPNLEESCVWCPRHYRIRSYVWQNGHFVQKGERVTHERLSPSEITGTPFVLKTSSRS